MAVGATDGTRDHVGSSGLGDRRSSEMRRPVGVRAAAAWSLGISGSVLAIAGAGPVAFDPADRWSGILRIVVPTVVFVAVVSTTWWRVRPWFVAVAALLTVTVTVVLTRGNLGRAPGLVASLGVVISWYALVGPSWSGSRHRATRGARVGGGLAGGPSTAVVPVALLIVTQVLWLADAGTALVLAILSLAGVQVLVTRLAPPVAERIEAPARDVVSKVGGVVARAGRSWGGWFSNQRRSVSSPAWLWAAVLSAAVVAAVFAPLFVRYASQPAEVLGFSDYVTHLEVASRVEFLPLHVGAPHPVFHIAVASLSWMGLVPATALVMSIVIAATVLVLVWFGRQPYAGRAPLDPLLAIAYGVGYFVIESPAMVAAALGIGNPYDWAPTNHMFLSPTDTLLVPFAIVLIVLLGRTIEAGARQEHAGWGLLVATTAATIAKPSMTLALLVAVPAVVVMSRSMSRRLVSTLATRFYVPSVIVVGAQTWMLEAGVEDIAPSGIALRPLETIRAVGLDGVGPLLVSPALVVLICLWADRRRYLAEPVTQLALWAMAAGLGILFVFNETGERSQDGTFTKPAFIAFIVLHLTSWRFLAGEFRHGEGRRPRAWVTVAAVFLAIGAVGGAVTYLEAVGLLTLPQRAGT